MGVKLGGAKPAIIETVVIGLLVGWVGWLSFCVDVIEVQSSAVFLQVISGANVASTTETRHPSPPATGSGVGCFRFFFVLGGLLVSSDLGFHKEERCTHLLLHTHFH